MKKVGILSMQRIKNYGSFLQAYALKKILEDLGDEVEFVDYHIEEPIIADGIKDKGKLKKGLIALSGKARLTHKINYIKHKKNFKNYFELLNITEIPNYNPKLDTLVIGSDEVFNVIQSNKNVGYSLELFGKNNNAKKVVTYAASFGNTTLDKINKYNKRNEIAELLKNINQISVRDQNSFNIVKKLISKAPCINLDPVLIYDYMKSNLIPKINTTEKYMILYAYNGRITLEEAKYIKSLAKKKNIKVYSIGGAQPYADKFIDCTPFEVLAYFKNTEYIVTDTFHGSIFSIINNKPFVTLVRKSKGISYGNEEKLTYLLENLKLKDRIAYSYDKIENVLNKKIDYKKTNEIIENERTKAINYLKKNV